jgi:iron only hydrogenase large subunit-like protein
MAAMAKIVKKYFPDHSVVFVSPCFAKQMMEAPKYKDVIDLVITFKELGEVFEQQGIKSEDFEGQEFEFDSFYEEDTKIYPISGGLAQTAHLHNFFKEEEVVITDEPANLIPIFEEIKAGTATERFFDILNCQVAVSVVLVLQTQNYQGKRKSRKFLIIKNQSKEK